MKYLTYCKILLTVQCWIGFTPDLSAQTLPVVRYSTADGLVQKQVMALYHDSSGYLWIGTKGGVSRFDGYRFRNYTIKEGLADNDIIGFIESRKGEIWALGKWSASIIRLGNPIKTISFPYDFRFSFAAPDGDGTAWLMATSGMNKLARIRKGVFEFIPIDTIQTGRLLYLHRESTSDKLIIRAQNGYFVLDRNAVIRIASTSDFPYLSPENWSGNCNDLTYPHKIKCTELSDFYPIQRTDTLPVFLSDGSYFWKDERTRSTMLFFTDTSGRTEIVEDLRYYLSRMVVDCYEQLWLGSEGGLMEVPSLAIRNYFDPVLLPDVWTILEDSSGRIWMGNYGCGLVYLDKSGPVRFSPDSFVVHSEQDLKGKTHIYPQGMIGFNGELFIHTARGVFKQHKNEFHRIEGFPSEPVYASVFDSVSGQVLFSIHDQGIYSLNRGGDVRQLVPKPGPEFEYIYALAEEPGGRIWIGATDTLVIWDQDHLVSMAQEGINFTSGAKAILSAGWWIFVANDFGLYARSVHAPLANKMYEVYQGPVNALVRLPGARIAFGTPDGIGVLDFAKWDSDQIPVISWLDKENGYLGGACQSNGLMVDSKNRLWIACERGAVSVDLSMTKDFVSDERLVFEEAWVLRNSQQWEQVFRVGETLRFPPNPNAIKIIFTLPDLRDSRRTEFFTRLSKIEKNWNSNENRREVTYWSLKVGRYRLEIKALGENNTSYLEVPFIVLPAWHQTLLFRLGSLILVLFSLAWLTWWYTRRRQRQKQDQIDRDRQLEDLRLRNILNQMDPHFSTNVLTSIGALVYTKTPTEVYQQITRFSRMLRSLVGKPESFLITLHEEIEFVTNYLELEVWRFPEKIQYKIDIESDINRDLLIPRMLIQIPVENAVKHGLEPKAGPGRLEVTIRNQPGSGICIRIEDDGIGRNSGTTALPSSGRGLIIFTEMLTFYSKTTRTENQFSLTDKTDENGQSAGTLFEIFLNQKLSHHD